MPSHSNNSNFSLSGTLNDTPVNIKLDSGADMTVVSESLLDSDTPGIGITTLTGFAGKASNLKVIRGTIKVRSLLKPTPWQ